MDLEQRASEIPCVFWLEPSHLHFHKDKKVEIKVHWGKLMQREPKESVPTMQAKVICPDGTLMEATIFQENTGLMISFFAKEEGLYTIIWEGKDEGILRAYQARVDVAVGHHVHGVPAPVSPKGLDLYALKHTAYTLDSKIILKVLYQGVPLSQAKVYGMPHLRPGEWPQLSGETNQEGEVMFTFPDIGHWMFMVCHTLGPSDLGGLQVATLVVPGVRN